ncbi:MAG: hypothetical protein WD029_07420 [Microthrixaceae bacterium]
MLHTDALNENFPEAISSEHYLARVARLVAPLGFAREHSFAAVSVCRDELTQSFTEQVAKRWDQPFNLGGLGALPSLGRTGWRAALSHVPLDHDRGHLIIFGLPHIGIDPAGNIGQSLRRHQLEPTPTCGAMAALLGSLRNGFEPLTPGLDDNEAERLRRIVDTQAAELPDNLLELTKLAAAAVHTEMWVELEALEAHTEMDIAVFCGIQIHLPDEVDFISPVTSSFMGSDGVLQNIQI